MSRRSQTNHCHSPSFLEGPSSLFILDDWVAKYTGSRNRFTFSEEEVLASLWAKGEDIRLREDIRFCEVVLPIPFTPRLSLTAKQWQLRNHIVINQQLYDLLISEVWDGHNLSAYLDQLEQNNTQNVFYVYCLDDARFLLSQDEQGYYHLALNTYTEKIELSATQKSVIDRVAPKLHTEFLHEERVPWTTNRILEFLKQICEAPGMLDTVALPALENWLLQSGNWARVGLDIWFPQQILPSPLSKHRYGVLPIFNPQQEEKNYIPDPRPPESDAKCIIQAVDQTDFRYEQEQERSYVLWKCTLRTVHLNEGYVPIPPKARIYYPRVRMLSRMLFIPGMWAYDASKITVWLDTETHRLFGDDLQSCLAFLETGTILEVRWGESGLTFWNNSVDRSVTAEEERLIDLTELANTRSTLLESYRKSLYTIMVQDTEKRWPFSMLYDEVTNRQQHKPNRSTIRAILSTSPEFLYENSSSAWQLNPVRSRKNAQQHLRRVSFYARQTVSQQISISKPLTLTDMISQHQKLISQLRSIYMPKENDSGSDILP